MTVTPNAPKRVAGYCRVSTSGQAEDGLSLAEQEAAIRQRVEQEGWELVELYTDAGVSGRRDRPELNRLLAALDGIDVLIVTKIDRLGRKPAGLIALYEQLAGAGVRLIPLGDPEFDSGTAAGKLVPNLLAVVAGFESEQLGERVKRTAAHLREGRPPSWARPVRLPNPGQGRGPAACSGRGRGRNRPANLR